MRSNVFACQVKEKNTGNATKKTFGNVKDKIVWRKELFTT